MAPPLTTQIDGTRLYLLGSTYAIKDQLRAAGCHWDGERKAWWIGRAKADAIQALLGSVPTAPTSAAPTTTPPVSSDRRPDPTSRVIGRATYKGRDYYVLAETRDGARRLLASRDGAISFWAAADLALVSKTYGRENYRSGRVEYPTLAGMIKRAEEWRQKSADERSEAQEDADARRSGFACPCSGGACRCGSDAPCCMCD
jgi:uncharacterized protein YbjT (DUF2867 family)